VVEKEAEMEPAEAVTLLSFSDNRGIKGIGVLLRLQLGIDTALSFDGVLLHAHVHASRKDASNNRGRVRPFHLCNF
jgi:hypothetical protein